MVWKRLISAHQWRHLTLMVWMWLPSAPMTSSYRDGVKVTDICPTPMPSSCLDGVKVTDIVLPHPNDVILPWWCEGDWHLLHPNDVILPWWREGDWHLHHLKDVILPWWCEEDWHLPHPNKVISPWGTHSRPASHVPIDGRPIILSTAWHDSPSCCSTQLLYNDRNEDKLSV